MKEKDHSGISVQIRKIRQVSRDNSRSTLNQRYTAQMCLLLTAVGPT